jgi:hypothetical protein
MAVTLNASTINGLIQTADTSGTLNLQANGTTVLSASPTGVAVTGTLTASGGFPGIVSGQLQTQIFTAPGTWTKPASCTQVKVLVAGGGGSAQPPALSGKPGGLALVSNIPVSAPVSITVGAGGAPGAGGTSSFGAAVSCTGGGAGAPGSVTGTATVSSGTNLRTVSGLPGTVGAGGAPAISAILSTYGADGDGQSTPAPAAIAYSVTGVFGAAQGGNGTPAASVGGVGGVVIVEFVG